MKINSLRKRRDWRGRIVFLRVDFNVPLINGRISEDHKIIAGLETVKFLLANQARLIVATHLGEPNGRVVSVYSTRTLARRLQKLLGRPVKFIPETVGVKAAQAVSRLKNGEVIFLENLRFNQGELDNDPEFAKELADLADIYINDAFAVSHREQASVSAIKKFLPAYAGLLLEKELVAMNRIIKPKRPLVVVMGGAKINEYSKAPLISQLLKPASRILIGGAIANNFFKLQKLQIGRSLNDPDSLKAIKKFFVGRRVNPKIILPIDVVVKTRRGKARCCPTNQVASSETILDIGPQTISLYASYIKKAATIIWNGPMGKFEEDSFRQGSLSVARLVASRAQGPAYGLVGGGETIEVLKLTKMAEYVDWISTAGGAMLTYLGGGAMPGLTKIVSK
ncbi:MAG: phosphoglycerate kinase [Patescibacteria group bacterium]|jgi:phosphoglycerate kinase